MNINVLGILLYHSSQVVLTSVALTFAPLTSSVYTLYYPMEAKTSSYMQPDIQSNKDVLDVTGIPKGLRP